MALYLLSVHGNEDTPPPPVEVMQKAFRDVAVFNQEVQDAGAWVFAGGLCPSSTATVVRVENGETLTTDGPFAESKEQIGGFWVIQADDLDAALHWATRASIACANPVEVRPFQDDGAG